MDEEENLNGKRVNINEIDKKRKKAKKWNKNSVVDKNKLTMFDLISYNPPLPVSKVMKNLSKIEETNKAEEKIEEKQNEVEENKSDSEDNDDQTFGPRVKINENGEIVIDEESLVIKRKKPKDKNITTVYEDDKTLSTRTNYSSFKKPGKSVSEKKLRWTDNETVKFYTALNIIGTDFTLMSELFFRNQRSRVDLKNKFKQEEKYHKVLIDNALKKSDLTSISNLEGIDFIQDVFSSDESDTEKIIKTKEKETLI